jgi:hypothetical protein
MVKIVDRAIGWARSRLAGRICYFCGVYESYDSNTQMSGYEEVLVCHRCLHQPMGYCLLDQMYWEEHPEKKPLCKHCRRDVYASCLWPMPSVRDDWYFCTDCVEDQDVNRYWRRIQRRLWERRQEAVGM